MIRNIVVGDKTSIEYIVEKDDSPRFLAEKGIYVMSTPRMIALMESTAKKLIDEKIKDPNYTSVGYHVDVYHKAPAPLGAKLVFTAEVTEIDGRRITFRVKCMYRDIVVGEGIHERVIVSWRRFLERVEGLGR